MSLILKLLGGSAGLYVVIAVLAVFGGLGATVWVEHATIGEYKAKLATETDELTRARADLKQTVAANATDQGVISSLQNALDTWKDSATKAAHDQEQMVKTLQATAEQLSAANAKLSTLETADNVLPNCQALEKLDISAVCPGHAAAERMHSSDANRVQGPGSKGAGPDTRTP